MTSTKPYFFRAFYDWIVDNGWTPLILVDATQAGVQVPGEHVKDGKIILNLAPRAVRDLTMENASISLKSRFGGVAHSIFIPIDALLAVYAEENGQILSFPPDAPTAPKAGGAAPQADSPHLVGGVRPAARPEKRPAKLAEAKKSREPETPDANPPKVRPTLRLIKEKPPVN